MLRPNFFYNIGGNYKKKVKRTDANLTKKLKKKNQRL